ncbi:glycosyl transferase family 2 [Anaerocolumna sp. AGMB13025]|uniref:tetratricopeptide repeat-containing glycosyltransferase n=1 Tax=Anaerocolumna sp. AGMB13025 TaxID=3039116 RepID=UPI00241FB7D2|nr:glycosyltransferase [Anaerocolumna sp. AGMB13025]WFR59113.1 glycosyl transferase family 2 [Anaerocolumna sp. AGMB13025]
MNKYKICVYAICKNEEQFVDRWMDAVGEADMVVVTDTGSTDNTVEKLRLRGAVVYTETINPWRFDTARNTAMNHIPEDVDICVPNDMDEVFETGWREKLEAAWQPVNTRAAYLFTWNYNADGTPNKQFVMEKIHRRHDFHWVHPVHEILVYTGESTESIVWVPGMVLNHRPDLSKPRSQYLPLLELSAKENPQDDRTAFWLGREYMFYGFYDKCISELKRHLSLPSAKWNEERCASMRFIAKCFQNKGDLKEARVWLYQAIAECPHTREPYLHMARLGYLQNDWPLVHLMTEKALAITEKTGSYLLETDAWGYELYDLAAICCYQLKLYEKAHNYEVMAIKLEPNDIRLKRNLELIDMKYNVKVETAHEQV